MLQQGSSIKFLLQQGSSIMPCKTRLEEMRQSVREADAGQASRKKVCLFVSLFSRIHSKSECPECPDYPDCFLSKVPF